LIPDKYAARGLPPIALSLLPYFVYFRSKNAKTFIVINIIMDTGITPPIFAPPRNSNCPERVWGLPPFGWRVPSSHPPLGRSLF